MNKVGDTVYGMWGRAADPVTGEPAIPSYLRHYYVCRVDRRKGFLRVCHTQEELRAGVARNTMHALEMPTARVVLDERMLP